MKAVLISLRPMWCEKIISGEKTLEVMGLVCAPNAVPVWTRMPTMNKGFGEISSKTIPKAGV